MTDDAKTTKPSGTTRDTEAADAHVHAGADRVPTPEEEDAAERAGRPNSDVERSYEDAMERGANQKGEGRLP